MPPTHSRLNLGGTTPEILIYDEFAPWAVSGAWVAEQLKACGAVDLVNCRINSPGGDIAEALACYNLLHQSAPKVDVYIDGMALSCAGWVAMAGDRVLIADGGIMMLHDPWTYVGGDAAALRKEADVLDKMKDSIVGIFAAKTGLDREAIAGLMAEETWLKAQEAVDQGFCDAIIPNKSAEMAPGNVDRSRYRNLPTWAAEQLDRRPGPSAAERAAAARRRQLDLVGR